MFTGAFTKTSDAVPHPDIQYHFFLFHLADFNISKDIGGFTMCVGTLRERSRGEVRLKSADPDVRPAIDFRFLSEPGDLEDLRVCVRQARDIASQPGLRPYWTREQETWANARTDAEIDEMIRRKAETGYHPSCSCRMGTDDLAVVDPECRARGLSGLRVVDSSIFPSITSGNLNAPSIMVGEKAADLIRQALRTGESNPASRRHSRAAAVPGIWMTRPSSRRGSRGIGPGGMGRRMFIRQANGVEGHAILHGIPLAHVEERKFGIPPSA